MKPMIPTVTLPGSTKSTGKLVTCGKCQTPRPREGAIEVRPGVTHCASCWAHRKGVQRPTRSSPVQIDPYQAYRVRPGSNRLS